LETGAAAYLAWTASINLNSLAGKSQADLEALSQRVLDARSLDDLPQ
jgi:hypothetical protein